MSEYNPPYVGYRSLRRPVPERAYKEYEYVSINVELNALECVKNIDDFNLGFTSIPIA